MAASVSSLPLAVMTSASWNSADSSASLPPFPVGDFEAGTEFRFGVVERVGEQAGNEGAAGAALDELRGLGEERKHHELERGAGQGAGGDVGGELRPTRERTAMGPLLGLGTDERIKPMRVAEVLLQQSGQLIAGETAKELVEPRLEHGAREAGEVRALVESEFAKWKFFIEPILA